MADNPYAAPSAELADPTPALEVPKAITDKIRHAWWAGIVSIGLTLVFTLLALTGGFNPLGMDAWALADIVLMCAFTFGIYKKSRASAILMLAFFLLNKAIMWMQSGQISGLPLALVFTWFYAQGVVGTFQYHKLMAVHRTAAV